MKKLGKTLLKAGTQKTQVRIISVLIFLLSVTGILESQTIRYVNCDATGSNNGTSWANAYTTLQPAITAATSGQQIWVAAGTYSPTTEVGGTGPRFRTFRMKNGVGIYGGFNGTETELSQRDFVVNETILSGTTDNVYHLFRHLNYSLNNTAVLDGFIITGGQADGALNEANGGGMFNQGSTTLNGSSPTINNCIFSGNSANLGGAMYNGRYSNPVITNSTFSDNYAVTNGGAVYNNRNNASFSNCYFYFNMADGVGTTGGGGAVYNNMLAKTEGTTITYCIFEDNIVSTDDARGGAIFNRLVPGKVLISNCDFTWNYGKFGAAIYSTANNAVNADSSDVIFSECRFFENEGSYGGGVYNEYHHTYIINSEFRGNNVLLQAGAIYNRFGQQYIINCLMAGCRAVNYGGAIYNNNSASVILNTTISGNYTKRGGGIAGTAGSAPEILNTIIWNNQASVQGDELFIGTDCNFNLDYSLFANLASDVFIDSAGYLNESNCLYDDPAFFEAIDPNSGSTPNTSGDYRIISNSPALDAGMNDYLPSEITTDLSGEYRIIDGNADHTTDVDLGSYELNPEVYFITWSGNEDFDWNNPNNWTPPAVPTIPYNVLIPAIGSGPIVYESPETPATCNDLTIEDGGILTISPGKAHTIAGDLINNSGVNGLVIQSDETGTGSLIEYNGVQATVENYLIPNQWHCISAPVDDPIASVFMGMYLDYWDEPGSIWTEIIDPEQVLSTDMLGYTLWTYNADTLIYKGDLNTGLKSIDVTGQGINIQHTGFNLIGNPYPSAINWNEDAEWTLNNILPTLWIWNPGIENYGVYIRGEANGINGADSIIPPHQGFFVHCTEAEGFLSVDDGARLHTGKTMLKSEEETLSFSLRMMVEGNGLSDEVLFSIQEAATINYDSQKDALKMRGGVLAPQFYSLSKDGKELSINAFPVSEVYNSIPVCLEVGTGTLYTFSVKDISGFDPSAKIYLEDKTEQTFTAFNNESCSYTFSAQPGDDPNRFVLHFNNEMAVNDHLSGSGNVQVFVSGDNICLVSNENLNGSVTIYNLIGQSLTEAKLNGQTSMNIDFQGQHGFVVVSVITEKASVNKKVFIK